jgi:hypothetical protein
MDEWKICLWKQHRSMRAIIEDHHVLGYKEVCFDESVNYVSEKTVGVNHLDRRMETVRMFSGNAKNYIKG